MEKTAHGTKFVMCSSRLCFVCLGLFIVSLFPGPSHCKQHEADLYDKATANTSESYDHDHLKQIIETGQNSSEDARAMKRNYFISKLFKQFANEEGMLSHEGLDKILLQLGLKDDMHEDYFHHAEGLSSQEEHDHSDHNHDGHDHSNHNHDDDHHSDNSTTDMNDIYKRAAIHNETNDLNLFNLLQQYGFSEYSVLSKDQFVNFCPGFLFYLVGLDHNHMDHEHQHVDHLETAVHSYPPPKVWGFSCLAVIIISLVGLLGVAVIPIMQKVFYNHLLQFLVALAVGALSGDAMLHLIPHAFQGKHAEHDHELHDDSNHTLSVMKGLCGLGGIYLFFIVERLLTIHTQQKRKKNQGKTKYAKNRTVFDEEMTTSIVGHGHSVMKTELDCEDMVMGIHPGHKALKNYAEESHNKDCHKLDVLDEEQNHKDCNQSANDEEPHLVLSHSHGGHGHSHCHNVPKTISAIAWMVILGDGIHNFSDGLAIGAAFASSIAGGVSTAIAVFCHELPHEIGDFAVLLRAGMKVKQALVYNCVSSVLAFLGMVIGIFLGNIDGASSWIFVGVAGMFLYIALVDMLPQVSDVDTKKGEHPLCHLLLQISGMFLGGGIMFLIAMFEHDMKNIM